MTTYAQPTRPARRIQAARRRVADAKAALAAVAGAGFIGVALLARSSHPAAVAAATASPAATSSSTAATSTGTSTSDSTSSPSPSTSTDDGAFGFQPGSVASPSGPSSTSTHAS